MSRENVDVVRTLQPQGDIARSFRDDETVATMINAAAPFFWPDFESVFVQPVEQSTHTGFDGLRAAWVEWLTPWEEYRTEIEDVIDLEHRVAVLTRDFGRRKEMELEVDFKGVSVYAFREGRIDRIEFHFDRAEGLEAVGLQE